MGLPSYIRPVVACNAAMRRVPVFSGYRGLFHVRVADNWPPSNGKAKNEWTLTSALPYTFRPCRGTATVPLPSQNTDIQWIQVRRTCQNASQSLRSRTSVARQIKWPFYPPTCHSDTSRHTITLDDRRGTIVDVSHWVSQRRWFDSWQCSVLGNYLLVMYVTRCQ